MYYCFIKAAHLNLISNVMVFFKLIVTCIVQVDKRWKGWLESSHLMLCEEYHLNSTSNKLMCKFDYPEKHTKVIRYESFDMQVLEYSSHS